MASKTRILKEGDIVRDKRGVFEVGVEVPEGEVVRSWFPSGHILAPLKKGGVVVLSVEEVSSWSHDLGTDTYVQLGTDRVAPAR